MNTWLPSACCACFFVAISSVTFAQSPGELSGSRSASPEISGKQLRVALAQYQATQRVLRQEYFLWTGQNPARPVVSPLPMFNVPYHNVYLPTLPVGRSLFVYGPEYRAF